MIDTHCHLTDPKFREDLDEVIQAAKNEGVEKIIVPGTDLRDSKLVDSLTKTHEHIYGLVGVYPGNAEKVEDLEETLGELKILVEENKKIVGIGEIGLDCYWNTRDLEKQKEVFRAQLKLAVEMGKPVVIHSRSSGPEIKEVFEEMKELPRGQFHCFGESEEFLDYVLEKDFFISFCGNITYPSAEGIKVLVRRVPLDRLLLETDSPYLPPQGKRGERNTPSSVKITAEFLANLKDVSISELSNLTNGNVSELFGI